MSTETQGKKSYKDSLNLPQTSFPMEAKLVHNEPLRLKKWQEMNLYQRLLEARAKQGKGKWILHDGPPFANGDIHIGHLINKNLKDVIIRFRTMEGYQTPYVPGWDCHGLPIEHKIQEEIKKEGKHIREMSTLDVRKRCYEYADKYAAIQSEQFQRLGILGDWANPYLTMRPFYESQTLEVFARFVEAGLVYKRLKPVPWSVANQTALADAELEYKDVEDPSVYVEFALDPGTEVSKRFSQPTFLLVWTTTPWTLPANLAVAVHPQIQYACVEYTRNGQQRVGIVARELVEQALSNRASVQSFRVLDQTYSGQELAERAEYLHPFIERKGRVVTADYVTTTDGTGLVHTAPGHGEDDYETGVRHGMEVYSPVKHDGRFDDTVPEFLRGKTTREANPLIMAELEKVGRLLAVQNIVHSYPHDWRSKTPIIFRATEQWFVAMDKPRGNGDSSLRDLAMQAISKKIEFFPAWGKARLEGMLQTRPDWCISRQRAWGLPIPVFYNEKGDALLTPQSVRAVAKRFAEKGSDAWFTDSPAELLGSDFRYPPGFEPSSLRKEKDIFDVWFESGSSWRAVLQCRDELQYPADLYLEGSDQHRGWFQLSLLPALGATGQPPFKSVLTHGFIVKPDSTKVSKSDKEYVTATQEVNRHGSDLLRLWCCSVDYQSDIPASPDAIKAFGDKYRKIRNTLRYLLSNLYDFNPQTDSIDVPAHSLDGWALAELDQLIVEVKSAYDTYQLHRAFRLLHDFCAVQVSAVYGNAMKDRLYCDVPGSPPRRRCQTVLHRMALALTKLLAPMLVYTADETWEHIAHKPAHDRALPSVHLALLPEPSSMQVASVERDDWTRMMELRSTALLKLDTLKKGTGLNKSLDAEIVFLVDDSELRKRLESFGADLEDLVSCGSHQFGPLEENYPAIAVKIIDRRNDYAGCARCWKRRPDVGKDAEFADLCQRCAAAVRGGTQHGGTEARRPT